MQLGSEASCTSMRQLLQVQAGTHVLQALRCKVAFVSKASSGLACWQPAISADLLMCSCNPSSHMVKVAVFQ